MLPDFGDSDWPACSSDSQTYRAGIWGSHSRGIGSTLKCPAPKVDGPPTPGRPRRAAPGQITTLKESVAGSSIVELVMELAI
jgi:hypothetical protein